MDLINKNLDYLVGKGFLYENEGNRIRGSRLPEAYSITPSTADSSLLTLSAESGGTSHWFHDEHSPKDKARSVVSSIKPDTAFLIVFGLGLGYDLEAILDKCPGLKN